MNATKISINDKEYDLPEGIEQLSEDGLYIVDWDLVEVLEPTNKQEEKFKFFNPRHLGKYEKDDGKPVWGQGLDGDSMKELMDDIGSNGLDYPLLGYFIVLEDGTVKVRVNDGERRWRCLDRMRGHNDKVWSAQYKDFMPAKEVYTKVLCRVKSLSEEEAFQRACVVSGTSEKWGDGACARIIKTLYERGKTDDEICKILNKGKQWLAETYSLNELDEHCFNFLLSGKINRKNALELVKVKDVKTRQEWLDKAWKDALENHAKVKSKNEKLVEIAEDKEELAEAEVEEAKAKGKSSKIITELEDVARAASVKTNKRKATSAASAKPVIKSRNMQKTGSLLPNALRPHKIKKKLEIIQEMIEKKDTSIVELKVLVILKHAYKCILEGEEDILVVLNMVKDV